MSQRTERNPTHSLHLSQPLSTPPATLWPLLTTRHHSARWLAPFHLESTWTPGGPFAIVGELAGKPYAETGELLALEAGRRLQFSHWSPLWRVPDVPAWRAVMTWELVDDGDGGCTFGLTHELPDVEAIAEHARFFWQGALWRLAALVEAEGTQGGELHPPNP